MLETPHSLIGGAIGAATGNPYAAAVLGTGSHFVGDLVPHWNPEVPIQSKPLYALVIADFMVAEGLVVAFWFWFPNHPEVAIGAFCGTLPDIILGIRYTFRIRWLRRYQDIHKKLNVELPIQYGLWPQLGLAVLSAWYLVSVHG